MKSRAGGKGRLPKLKNKKETLLFLAISEGVAGLLALLCYDSLRWLLPLQLLLFPFYRIGKKRRAAARKQQYIQGFQEVLQSFMTSLQAGYSLENACRTALAELESLYPSGRNPTVRQMRKIVRGIELHTGLEQLFLEYAEETQVDEIYEFAVILGIARSTGGNVVDILKNAMGHLQMRMEAAEELSVSLSGRIYEKNIMLLMPFGVLLYLRLANPGYVDRLYDTALGNGLMSLVILFVLFSFFWTEKIMDIEF